MEYQTPHPNAKPVFVGILRNLPCFKHVLVCIEQPWMNQWEVRAVTPDTVAEKFNWPHNRILSIGVIMLLVPDDQHIFSNYRTDNVHKHEGFNGFKLLPNSIAAYVCRDVLNPIMPMPPKTALMGRSEIFINQSFGETGYIEATKFLTRVATEGYKAAEQLSEYYSIKRNAFLREYQRATGTTIERR